MTNAIAQRRNAYSANKVIAFLQDITSDESDADGSTNMDTEYEDVNYNSTMESDSDASELESLCQAKPPSKCQTNDSWKSSTESGRRG